MKRLPLAVVFAALLVSLGAARTFAQDWTRFRGPNGSGVSEATTVPSQWTDEDYNWKINLPGEGHSCPVIWGDRLFITTALPAEGTRLLLCLDTASGNELWRRQFPFETFKKHRGNSYATNTPAVDAQRVYALWQSRAGSSLVALDHSGKTLWEFDLGIYKSGHGTGSSPIVYNDMVVVCNDHDGDSFLIALDAASGAVRWKVDRIGDRACYSTPCIYEHPDRAAEIIFTHSYRGITGVDAAGGKVNWQIDVFGTHQQRAVASPVIYGDLVIGSSGFTTAEKNVVAVRPHDTADGYGVDEIYRLNKQVPHIPTPVVYKGWLFLWTDTGIVSCFEAASGKVVWQKRVGGNFFGSPICVGKKLYCIDDGGVVTVLAASDEFEQLGQVELGQACRSTPTVSHGVMYLRTVSQLFSLGGKK